jgi:hypothetical protein
VIRAPRTFWREKEDQLVVIKPFIKWFGTHPQQEHIFQILTVRPRERGEWSVKKDDRLVIRTFECVIGKQKQAVQIADPVTVLYVCASQIVQLPPSGPVNPWLQMQLLDSIDPMGDCEFKGQAVQIADPVTVLYVFASQIVQLPPSGPVNPWLQMQLLDAVEPMGDCEFKGQAVQLADPVTLL